MRRSVAAPDPENGRWVPWIVALVAVVGFLLGGLYLYRHGLLGTPPPKPETPVQDSMPPAAAGDSAALHDSALLVPELQRFDSTRAPDTAHRRPSPVVTRAAEPQFDTGVGILRFGNLPPRSQVFIDSKPVTQAGAEIRVGAGRHEVGVSAPGYSFYTDSVRVEAGKTLQLSPTLSSSDVPPVAPGSREEFRRRVLARLDCENPSPVNRFGRLCYDTPPQPLGGTRVPIPPGLSATPTPVTVIVKVSRQGRTLVVRTRNQSNEEAFTRAVEAYAETMKWTPAMREGQPVDGWTQYAFQPDLP